MGCDRRNNTIQSHPNGTLVQDVGLRGVFGKFRPFAVRPTLLLTHRSRVRSTARRLVDYVRRNVLRGLLFGMPKKAAIFQDRDVSFDDPQFVLADLRLGPLFSSRAISFVVQLACLSA